RGVPLGRFYCALYTSGKNIAYYSTEITKSQNKQINETLHLFDVGLHNYTPYSKSSIHRPKCTIFLQSNNLFMEYLPNYDLNSIRTCCTYDTCTLVHIVNVNSTKALLQ
ncbi:unnamed protein product, partial [Owenia fusiformis]